MTLAMVADTLKSFANSSTDGTVRVPADCIRQLADHIRIENDELMRVLCEVAHHADDECGFMVSVRDALQKSGVQ